MKVIRRIRLFLRRLFRREVDRRAPQVLVFIDRGNMRAIVPVSRDLLDDTCAGAFSVALIRDEAMNAFRGLQEESARRADAPITDTDTVLVGRRSGAVLNEQNLFAHLEPPPPTFPHSEHMRVTGAMNLLLSDASLLPA
jgi:hypothetical protein